ncbi:MAG: hypothetical protein CVV64_20025 [Candidatus Wallbacteria bacterium HGW-Wallbacteria-1]|uniref:Flagellin C-terminal domain-containing protein n=1 Tax=Candidatus Wallbacteria bacterium HGW-Wallbacteria-1 TaxID=2013854 RepID=A0A2N1PIM5_9BACT|nr:MAG: hypothetical protein CVV64_20025 [Candidatus Wallbacteria bacterium HGW-Wallbacteria-1]
MVSAGETETITFVQPHRDKEAKVTLASGDTINEAITKMQDTLDREGFEVDVSWDIPNNTFLFESRKRGSAYNFFASGSNSTGTANDKIIQYDPNNGSPTEDADGDGFMDEGNGAGMNAFMDQARDIQVRVYTPNGSSTLLTSRTSTFRADLETYDKDKAVDDGGYNQGIVGLEFTLDIDDVTSGSVLVKAGLDVSGLLTIQAGPNKGSDHRISMAIPDMGASALGIEGLDITTQESSQNLIDAETLDKAISVVSTARGNLGALQNRLEHTIKNLSVTKENLASSESRIRDTDMAKEMMEFTRNQIMQQAGTAMLAQANQVPQSVLQLLG